MKITFIYPSLADKFFNPSGGDMTLRSIHPGLCQLSASLKSAGFQTELIELRTLKGWGHFQDKIVNSPLQVAAITMMSPDFPLVKKCTEIIKRVNPSAKIIVGGMHPTIKPEDALSDKNIDYIVRGEGETALVSLSKALESGVSPARIMQGERAAVDDLPFVDRYLFNCLESPWDFFLPLPYFTIMAGRGCGYSCKFCAPGSKMVHGKGTRRRAVKKVMEELKILRDDFGMNSFMFNDDCFTEDKDWVCEFAEQYKSGGFKQDFICQTRADIICENPKMVGVLVRTGLKMAIIGFESGNDRILKFISKGVTAKQNLEAAKICKSYGLRIFASYMLGLPTETNDEVRDTVKLLKKIKPYRPAGNYFTPLPGSYPYSYCKEKGLSLIDDYDCVRISTENEKPRVKGIDHEFIISAMKEAQKLPLEAKIIMKCDKLFRNRKNRIFLRAFRKLAGLHPDKHIMDILYAMKHSPP